MEKVFFCILVTVTSSIVFAAPLTNTGNSEQKRTETLAIRSGLRDAVRCGTKGRFSSLNDTEYTKNSKWPSNIITWGILKYSRTSRLSHGEQRRLIKRGMERWAAVTPLVFVEKQFNPDLKFSFEVGDHGHGNEVFDGKGGIYAHADYPTSGLVHFDDDDSWVSPRDSSASRRELDLENIAAHEVGHALGLDHSNHYRNALMYATYIDRPADFTLHWEDIARIQGIYGTKPAQSAQPAQRMAPLQVLDAGYRGYGGFQRRRDWSGNGFCGQQYTRIDAAMTVDGVNILFVDYNYVIDGRNGNKMEIGNLFPNGPFNVQGAVYSERIRKVYLVQNEEIWSYSVGRNGEFIGDRKNPFFLPELESRFPECAIEYNGKIYLIKNGMMADFDPNDAYKRPVITSASQYFSNLPSEIDAAIQSNRGIYFISKNRAYQTGGSGVPVNQILTCRN